MNGILSDLLLRMAKRRPCFSTQRVTRLYLQPVTPVTGAAGLLAGRRSCVTHGLFLSWSLSVLLCVFNLESISSRADFSFLFLFFLVDAHPRRSRLWEMLWVIPAGRGLADPTACEGREPLEGFPLALPTGTFCCRECFSPCVKPQTWDSPRRG